MVDGLTAVLRLQHQRPRQFFERLFPVFLSRRVAPGESCVSSLPNITRSFDPILTDRLRRSFSSYIRDFPFRFHPVARPAPSSSASTSRSFATGVVPLFLQRLEPLVSRPRHRAPLCFRRHSGRSGDAQITQHDAAAIPLAQFALTISLAHGLRGTRRGRRRNQSGSGG